MTLAIKGVSGKAIVSRDSAYFRKKKKEIKSAVCNPVERRKKKGISLQE